MVEQEPESKVVPSVKGAASSICYGPVDRLFIVARYTNTHSLADTQLLLPPKQCPAGRVFQYRVGSGRVLDKIPGSGSGSGRVGVSKNMIGYFRVSFFLLGISGYFGYFRVCRVFSGISGFTHIY